MKRIVKFKDKEEKIVITEINIEKENNNKNFSMTFERNNCYGQTKFYPKSEAQQKLYQLWKNYHLNNLSPGLPIQNEAVKNIKKYEEQKKKLEKLNLLHVPIPENIPEGYILSEDYVGEIKGMYTYGTSWITRKLPLDIEDIVNNICNEIEEEEKNRIKKLKEIIWNDIDDAKIIALGMHLELKPEEAKEDIVYIDDLTYSYSGMNYYVCTDDEADDLFEEYTKEFINECILRNIPKDLQNYFNIEKFIEDIKLNDGRGNTLSSYNGVEYEIFYENTYYYIYNQ